MFAVDSSESELGILDLIQVFVESLDQRFENVCELDLIFHVEKVHHIVDEICMGGMVLETNMAEILKHVDQKTLIMKKEARDPVCCCIPPRPPFACASLRLCLPTPQAPQPDL